jgi:4-amino-4-deoxy-L-arabinose transferase-like glycosyltransferase
LHEWRAWLPAAFLLLVSAFYLYGISGVGLLGPDEPRYAFIGREMARSGEWLTPRLWGEPWFEKPPLLYWMTAAGFRLGLGPELAPRAPVALLSVFFLLGQWLLLRKLLDERTAWLASLINATSAGWVAYSKLGVTDLPLAACFQMAVLMSWLALEMRAPAARYGAAACLAAAVLAKGLVPLVLFLPVLWFLRKDARAWAGPAALFLLLAAPWYATMTWMHGRAFLDEFFLRHHFSRFTSAELQHVQPFWFYAPVAMAGLLPWTPALMAVRRRAWLADRLRIPLLIFVFGFIFFSISRNKLPGYLLPVWPSLCILLAGGLVQAPRASRPLFWTVMLAGLSPAAASMLPEALLYGVTNAQFAAAGWQAFVLLLPVALGVWWLDLRGRRAAAAAITACAAAAGFASMQAAAAPALDQIVSARGLWRLVAPRKDEVCIGRLHRAWRYGLAYYAGAPLPDCVSSPRPLVIDQPPEGLPRLLPAPGAEPAAGRGNSRPAGSRM